MIKRSFSDLFRNASDDKKRKLFGLYILAVIAIFSAVIIWSVFQWHECRDMGFSFWFCVQHVS